MIRRLVTVAAFALQLVGSLLLSLAVSAGIGQLLMPPAQTATAEATCTGCPNGIVVGSVTVQAREGSTLFSFDGAWPASVAGLTTDIRLTANDAIVQLRPHPSPPSFEIVSATRAGVAIPPGDLAASLRAGSLLIDIADRDAAAPLTFGLAFVRDGSEVGHFPGSGALAWNGGTVSAAAGLLPVTAGASSPTGAAIPATSSPSPEASPASTGAAASPAPGSAPVDLTVLARACSTIPAGPMPPYLLGNKVGTNVSADPRSRALTRWVGVGFGSSLPGPAGRPPFSVTAVIVRPGQATGHGPTPIDGHGSLQLWIYWDGSTLYKGIRTWDGTRWAMRAGTAAEPMTIELQASGAVWFWSGIHVADRYGFVEASTTGCATTALSSALDPLEVVR